MQAVDEGHVVSNDIRHRCEQVSRLDHHVDRLIRIAEHGDARISAVGFFAPLKLPRLAEGLKRRNDFLWHLLQVSHFVEGDHVPDRDHAFVLALHMAEHIGHGRRPRQQRTVGRDLLDGVALARTAGSQFDHVEVAFRQRNQPHEK